MEPLYQKIQQISGLKAAFYHDNYENVYFLEVFSSQASKSLAVLRLKEMLGAGRVSPLATTATMWICWRRRT